MLLLMTYRGWGKDRSWRPITLRQGWWADLPSNSARRATLARWGSGGYDQNFAAPPARPTVPRDERLARLEAVLFVAKEALGSRKLAQLAQLADGTEARTLVGQLNRFYDLSASAFRVEEVAGGYRLFTRVQFGAWLRRVHQTPLDTKLSAPALETLAVVAYRQPILRSGIEAIRGVQCGEILRQLLDRDFIRIVGRSNELGRPFIYGTTKRFLEMFGLRSLEELPRGAELKGADGENGRAATTQLPNEEHTVSYSSDKV